MFELPPYYADRLAPRAIVFFPETSGQDVDEVMRNIQSVSESIRVLPLKFTEEDLRAFQGPQLWAGRGKYRPISMMSDTKGGPITLVHIRPGISAELQILLRPDLDGPHPRPTSQFPLLTRSHHHRLGAWASSTTRPKN
ncbi:predicted protein [Chaetomium globosum CBS 148.51]|uniref:Uncharacterized protein n=1 Tax=Chaetomium globosum (strain ATCC 6205 / CBS 148.51 / DSM 1962 / NBRC 6347 / NRRL 1970) TaxID=306901 RepID=Q2GM48_CHAGB|nr:uncharacterized protein CHGG_10956 [Chaetomium globosum CBS 148.51]EAQ83138.1 predicted protein [Chaetomium globosum CBS 148.51]